jgi:hypothetical protein
MSAHYGLIKPSLDAHTLGINAIKGLLMDCGQLVSVADEQICKIVHEIHHDVYKERFLTWLKDYEITHLGISYRLDPHDAKRIMGHVMFVLKENQLLAQDGGPIRRIFFAGLPPACELVKTEHGTLVDTFEGSESLEETLLRMGVAQEDIPLKLIEGSKYDEALHKLARSFIQEKHHLSIKPPIKGRYPEYGTRQDKLSKRILDQQKNTDLPLMRVHVGPYLDNRQEAVDLFVDWCKQLAKTGYLDIVSIGSSQLTQSNFNEDWSELSNGGGVPIQNELEYRRIYDASRPLLVRTYSGTKKVHELAPIHERSINIAWHALSFWWFNQLDGRGPNDLYTNLKEHLATLEYIAKTDKPFEPNIPHHFAFRGADDVTYILSAVLAAYTAKAKGVKDFVLQIMLNTPRSTWGLVDLAKARATLQLIKPLIDDQFKVYLQPRAGLDYFAPDEELAKIQLAQVSMLMDDIEPDLLNSPPIVHVVSYSEALYLATPEVIDESIQITLGALHTYRQLKKQGLRVIDKFENDVQARTNAFVKEARQILNFIKDELPEFTSPEGLYAIFASGLLPTPYLWANQESFPLAIQYRSSFKDGSTILLDEKGKQVHAEQRIQRSRLELKRIYQSMQLTKLKQTPL